MSDNPFSELLSGLKAFREESERTGNMVDNACDTLSQRFRLELTAAVEDPVSPLTERGYQRAMTAFSEILNTFYTNVTNMVEWPADLIIARHVIASLENFISMIETARQKDAV